MSGRGAGWEAIARPCLSFMLLALLLVLRGPAFSHFIFYAAGKILFIQPTFPMFGNPDRSPIYSTLSGE